MNLLRNIVGFASAALLITAVLPARAERLPQTVTPEHYDLKLTPDLKNAKFSGVEQIDVVLKEASATITLNSAEIEFQSVTVRAGGNEQTGTTASDKEKEQTTFTFPQQIPAGKATLTIHYSGILNNALRGFYLSKTDKRNYAVTQFESTDARRAFPSFDEPAFKATYNVALVVDRGDTAISNSPIKSDTPGPGDDKHTIAFDTTPKMSTYLVAFLIGDFQCTGDEQDGVKIRVCSTPDKVQLTHFGVEIAKYVLHYYNNYFGIPYPLKKLDLIGLPDFEAGAMENFGAVTYRETALLIDPKTASVESKKEVASVIAHEMAHQWFGDLVTMQWWNNVWLNEGFATWMSNKPIAAMHPEWNFDQDVIAEEDGTLNLDAQPTTRAIKAKADTREEIEQMFDGISYGKASDVLLMVENYLGEDTFRKGVHAYLAAHLYGNATAEDFWNAQTETSHKPVDKIMSSYVDQPGVPILTFGKPAHDRVSLTQKRFYLSPKIEANAAQKWTVPVCFRTAAGTETCEVLTPGEASLRTPTTDLFFANAGGKGFYRIAYPADVYATIVAHVESDLRPTERISLLGDEWAQVRADKASVGDYLNLVAAVKADKSAAVVSTALGQAGVIYDRIASTQQQRDGIAKWVRDTFLPAYERLGTPSDLDTPNTRELRARLFGVLGYYARDPKILSQAREIATRYLDDPAAIDATLGQTALSIAARNGDADLFNRLQKVYETSNSPELQSSALQVLAQFENPDLAKRSMDYALTDKVRSQDAAIQFAIEMQAEATREQAWQYIQNHWDAIHGLLTPELGNILVGSTGSFCSEESREQIEQFFSAHKVASADQAAKHAVERINGCMELRKLQGPNLDRWLAEHAR
ncbi:M1 family metallopeptidase [Acidobacteria bacterium AB60]|nr:M1 family metallopeptidase [Acidobacteria bacterium AB60]